MPSSQAALNIGSQENLRQDNAAAKLSAVVRKAYVPLVSVLLVVGFGTSSWMLREFDPLTVAQNARLRFQSAGESRAVLPPREAWWAEIALQRDRKVLDARPKVLFLGNSQSLAIMDDQPGDMTTPQWLQVLLGRAGEDPNPKVHVILGSLPNLTAAEMFLKLFVAGESQPGQADVLVYAPVLTGFRSLAVRTSVKEVVTARPQMVERLFALVRANRDLSMVEPSLSDLKAGKGNGDKTGEANGRLSTGEWIEQRVEERADSFPLVSMRAKYRGVFRLAFDVWKKRLFGIKTSTPRPVPRAAYLTSMQFIELALRYAQSHGIRIFVYLPPVRPLQPNPNVPADLARFRVEMPVLCQRYGARCVDYSDLIPEKLWTNYGGDDANRSEPDFAHFTGPAHKLLAETLAPELEPLLAQK